MCLFEGSVLENIQNTRNSFGHSHLYKQEHFKGKDICETPRTQPVTQAGFSTPRNLETPRGPVTGRDCSDMPLPMSKIYHKNFLNWRSPPSVECEVVFNLGSTVDDEIVAFDIRVKERMLDSRGLRDGVHEQYFPSGHDTTAPLLTSPFFDLSSKPSVGRDIMADRTDSDENKEQSPRKSRSHNSKNSSHSKSKHKNTHQTLSITGKVKAETAVGA
eukprot:TRINITY_DN151_c0_g1_i2.p1 TRINITY_DN151_c0_g1~~TRINITY_DN151_c0_g1_i2.p1  ORF type:complete len:216 (-),score=24.13 TRINITY_DN151_c0_g1_i2:763-1410(-)